MRVCVLTSSYPLHQDDMSGWFVHEQCLHLAQLPDLDLTVLAPAHPGVPALERHGRLEIRRLRYFFPASLQRLAYRSGIISNLKSRPLAWFNLIPFSLAFSLAAVRFGRSADVIHAHWGPMALFAIVTRPFHRRPVVLSVRGSDLFGSLPLVKRATAWAVRHSDAVSANTPVSQRAVAAFRPDPDFCRLIPNGLALPDLDHLLSVRAARTDRSLRIISVGRLVPERRYDLLIRAFARLHSSAPDLSLIIIGDGPHRPALDLLISDLGLASSVTFLGRIPHSRVSAFLAESDIYVSATDADTFANALLEGAAHALPVVATRVGYPAEVVLDGSTGFLVDPGDLDALTAAIRRLASDPARCRDFGLAMRRRIEDLGLSWSRCAAQTAQLYHDVINRSPRRV